MITVRTYPEKIYPGIHTRACIDVTVDKNSPPPVYIKLGKSHFTHIYGTLSYKDSSNNRRICACIEIPADTKPDAYPIPFEITLKDHRKLHGNAHLSVVKRRHDTPPDILSDENGKILEHYCVSPPTSGNRIDVLYDGTDSFLKFKDLLESAQHSIHLQTFLLENKGRSDELYEILKDKARRGLDVKVILTRYSQLGTSPSVYPDLRMNGVDVIMIGDISFPREKVTDYTPWHKLMQDQFLMLRKIPEETPFSKSLVKQSEKEFIIEYALHEKMIIVDGKRAITGGRNIADRYFFWWKDMDLYMEGPVVTVLNNEFMSNWKEFGGRTSHENPAQTLHISEEDLTASITDSKPWKGNYSTLDMLCSAIGMSKQSVFITTQYIALPEKLAKTLEDAASRGVDVRILTNSFETGQEVAFSLCHFISLNYYRELLFSGIKIYEYQSPKEVKQKPYFHAKEFIIDGVWTSIGSFNLSIRSAYLESEIQVNIPDIPFSEERQGVFLSELAVHSHEITLYELAREEDKYGPLINAAKMVELLY